MCRDFVTGVQFGRNVILVTVIVQLVFMCGFLCNDEILFNNDDEGYGNREVNDSCKTKNRTQGICTLSINCLEVLIMIRNRRMDYTVCGFEGSIQIVCCPVNIDKTTTPTPETTTAVVVMPPSTLPPTRIDASDHDCINKGTGEKGIIKFARYCPELNFKIPDLVDTDLCSYHDFALCYDVVCCPIRNSTRLKQKCRYFDDPDNEMKLRANLNFECDTPPNLAYYTTECQQTDLRKVALTNASTIQPQCCPLRSIKKFEPWDSSDFRFVKVYGRNCNSNQNANVQGICRPHNQCPMGSVVDQNSCYVQRNTQFVCCREAKPSGPKPFEQACYNYSQEVYAEMYRLVDEPIDYSSRIWNDNARSLIEGILSKPTEYPHIVALGYTKSQGEIEFSCSGSLISEKFVLTVAQCLRIYDLSTGVQKSVTTVRVAITTLHKSWNSDDCPMDYDVEKLIAHPNYSRDHYYNDIGLIKLVQPVRFNSYVRPICLPNTATIPPTVIALGYGANSAINATTEKLVKILLDTYTTNECTTYFDRPFKKLYRGIDAGNQVCAGSKSLLFTACPADSGGSIVAPHPEFYETSTLIGLAVYNNMCGFLNNPGIYTLIYPYRDWIESIVWNSSQ